MAYRELQKLSGKDLVESYIAGEGTIDSPVAMANRPDHAQNSRQRVVGDGRKQLLLVSCLREQSLESCIKRIWAKGLARMRLELDPEASHASLLPRLVPSLKFLRGQLCEASRQSEHLTGGTPNT